MNAPAWSTLVITSAVAALVLFAASNAQAAEPPQFSTPDYSPKASKIIKELDAAGFNDPRVHDFVDYVDTNTHNGYLNFMQEPMMGGNIVVRYKLSAGMATRDAELHFMPTDSHMDYIATTRGALAKYELHF